MPGIGSREDLHFEAWREGIMYVGSDDSDEPPEEDTLDKETETGDHLDTQCISRMEACSTRKDSPPGSGKAAPMKNSLPSD